MFNAKWSTLASLFVLLPSACPASHCPGNVASVHVRHVEGFLAVVPVQINGSGPYDFLVDTGAQITSLDPTLATALHLKPDGTIGLVGVDVQGARPYAHLASLKIGSYTLPDGFVAVKDQSVLRRSDSRISGALGGDVLRNFDVLLDQADSILCLDRTGTMQKAVRGERIALVPRPRDTDSYSVEPVVVSVRVAGTSDPLHLLIDSGTNVPFLMDGAPVLARKNSRPQQVDIVGGDGLARSFVKLPPIDMQIGLNVVHQVSFRAPSGRGTRLPQFKIDGLLPIGLFRRVYIDYNHQFVVLEPW